MIHGEYNRLKYTVFSDEKPIYTAGNAPGDSQAYVPAKKGVGLAGMRSYCWVTCREMAEERKEELGSIIRREDDDEIDTAG